MLLYTHTAIKCSQLDPISNGIISYNPDSVVGSYDLATIATHSCNEGFYLSGAITRECTGDISSSFGSWNGRSAPTCMGNLYNVMFHNWSSISWQHTCMTLDRMTPCYYCIFSIYTTHSNFRRVIIISECGVIIISLTAIECPRLTAPTNGFVDYTPTSDTFPFDYLTTGTFRCRFGYRLAGGNTVRTCVGSSSGPGEWTGTDPICEGWYF